MSGEILHTYIHTYTHTHTITSGTIQMVKFSLSFFVYNNVLFYGVERVSI